MNNWTANRSNVNVKSGPNLQRALSTEQVNVEIWIERGVMADCVFNNSKKVWLS